MKTLFELENNDLIKRLENQIEYGIRNNSKTILIVVGEHEANIAIRLMREAQYNIESIYSRGKIKVRINE